MGERMISVAAVQWEVRETPDFSAFADQVTGLIRRTDAQIVLFPELFTVSLFTAEPDWRQKTMSDFGVLTRYTDEYRALFRDLAAERSQVILAGSHLVDHGSEVRNVAHLFTPEGKMYLHQKTHIFPAEGDWHTGEGEAYEVIDLGYVKAGIAICYEAEIPEVATILTRRGADLILCPSFTFSEAGFWRVRHCCQARCIENQVYFVHCSTTGDVGAPLSPGWARSSILTPCDLVFNPNGVAAEAKINEEDVIQAYLDLDLLEENRRNGSAPTFRDRMRRSDLYKAYSDELLGWGTRSLPQVLGED